MVPLHRESSALKTLLSRIYWYAFLALCLAAMCYTLYFTFLGFQAGVEPRFLVLRIVSVCISAITLAAITWSRQRGTSH